MADEIQMFKTMVERNRALLTSLREDPIQSCKCINPNQLEHLMWMLDECVHLFETNWREKANRWLGFVQGCLSKDGISLDDLKSANTVVPWETSKDGDA